MKHLLNKEREIRAAMSSGNMEITRAVERVYLRLAEESRFFQHDSIKLFVFIYYGGDDSSIDLASKCYVGDRSVYRYRNIFIAWIEFYQMNPIESFTVPKIKNPTENA